MHSKTCNNFISFLGDLFMVYAYDTIPQTSLSLGKVNLIGTYQHQGHTHITYLSSPVWLIVWIEIR